MRWLLGVVLVVGCGPIRAEAVENSGQRRREWTPKPPQTFVAKAARPDISIALYVPDFHEELRWPLSGMSHPALEPRFPVAQELAIGVDWQQLCARGVHMRISATQKELLSYLHGWCDVLNGDIDAACGNLRPLFGSVTRGLTSAVRQDLANILASEDAENAERWLSRHKIRDIPTLDLLAANYVEVGSAADAFAINRRAIDSDGQATDATKCRRLAKQIVIAHEVSSTFAIEALKNLATSSKVPDPLCQRLHNKVRCWLKPATACLRYLTDENISSLAMSILDAYHRWPYEAGFSEWAGVAKSARGGLPLEGAAELAITALEAGLRADLRCPVLWREDIANMIQAIRIDPVHGPYEPRLRRIEAACADDNATAATPTP